MKLKGRKSTNIIDMTRGTPEENAKKRLRALMFNRTPSIGRATDADIDYAQEARYGTHPDTRRDYRK